MAHDIEQGEKGKNIEKLRRGIKNIPQMVNSFVEKVYDGDREKLQKVLKDDMGFYSAHLISSNAEYLSPEVQNWLRMIREGQRKIMLEDIKRLRELAFAIQRSFPSKIEKWIQKQGWENFGRQADYTKLRGLFDVRNHAKRVTQKCCQASL